MNLPNYRSGNPHDSQLVQHARMLRSADSAGVLCRVFRLIATAARPVLPIRCRPGPVFDCGAGQRGFFMCPPRYTSSASASRFCCPGPVDTDGSTQCQSRYVRRLELSVAAMCVCNTDRSPVGINRLDAAQLQPALLRSSAGFPRPRSEPEFPAPAVLTLP